MNKQEILCFQVPIKSPKQINDYKKRQQYFIPATPKIILGKLLENNVQQIWTQEYKCLQVSALRELHSSHKAFQIALEIIKATKELSKIYGNFILNENMVFLTKSKKTFIWINPDILVNTSKIYLPRTKQGEYTMIKGLINYFKLWLQTQYSTLSQVKSLEQLDFKIHELKRQKPPTLSKDISLAAFSNASSKDSFEKLRLYQSTKGITLKKFVKNLQYSNNNSKNSDSSSTKEKCLTSQPFGQKIISRRFFNGKVQTSQASNIQSDSNAEKSFSNSFSKEISKSFRNVKAKDDQPKFPNKTTSSTLQILQKIKQQDSSPEEYTTNKILISDSQKLAEQHHKTNLKTSLGGINQELDNLFLSNIESEENEQAIIERQKEFSSILDL